MRRTQKTKPEITAELPIQIISENFADTHIVISADGEIPNISRKKRKEEANKPLYLKRV